MYQAYLEFCVELWNFVRHRYGALNPDSPMWEYINRSHTLLSNNNKNSHVYLEEAANKGDVTGNG